MLLFSDLCNIYILAKHLIRDCDLNLEQFFKALLLDETGNFHRNHPDT